MNDFRALTLLAAGVVAATMACGTENGDRPRVVPSAMTEAPPAAVEGTAPDGNYALRFGGTGVDDLDRVKIPVDDPTRAFAADVGASDMTIELYLRARPGDNPAEAVNCGEKDAWIYGNIVLDRDRFGQGRKFGLSVADGVPVFGLTGGDDSVISMCGRTRIDDDRWHHVAVTRSVADGATTLFVDGRPEAEVPAGPAGDVSYPDGAEPQASCDGGQPCVRSDPFLVIGAEKHDAGEEFPSFRGQVDELRLSTVVRYPGPFSPPGRRFAPDADTAALYHFDEGGGTVAGDAATVADAPSNGVLVVGDAGPTWVPADAPTGP